MATSKHIKLRTGHTEPLTGYLTLTATADLATGDLSTLKMYARESSASTNHVDGVAVSSFSVASVDNGDGTYAVTITYTFDPVDAKNGGGNAWDTAGTYDCELDADWADADITKHPPEALALTVVVADSLS